MDIKRLIPARVRRAVTELLGIRALRDRVHQLEERLLALESRIGKVEDNRQPAGEESSSLWETSRKRWQSATPNKGLTWGASLSGDAFIEKVASLGGFGPRRTILELGPGYGRLPRSILAKGVEFSKYIGVDLSKNNVDYLRSAFPSGRMEFLEADAELCALELGFDLFLSSLTMKHLFPTFEACLANLSRFANPGCRFFFDLIEGEGSHFEHDGVTYIRQYSRQEVGAILGNVGLELVAFDQVRHDSEHVRLLVVAQKAAA